jgi:hypothetical protein
MRHGVSDNESLSIYANKVITYRGESAYLHAETLEEQIQYESSIEYENMQEKFEDLMAMNERLEDLGRVQEEIGAKQDGDMPNIPKGGSGSSVSQRYWDEYTVALKAFYKEMLRHQKKARPLDDREMLGVLSGALYTMALAQRSGISPETKKIFTESILPTSKDMIWSERLGKAKKLAALSPSATAFVNEVGNWHRDVVNFNTYYDRLKADAISTGMSGESFDLGPGAALKLERDRVVAKQAVESIMRLVRREGDPEPSGLSDEELSKIHEALEGQATEPFDEDKLLVERMLFRVDTASRFARAAAKEAKAAREHEERKQNDPAYRAALAKEYDEWVTRFQTRWDPFKMPLSTHGSAQRRAKTPPAETSKDLFDFNFIEDPSRWRDLETGYSFSFAEATEDLMVVKILRYILAILKYSADGSMVQPGQKPYFPGTKHWKETLDEFRSITAGKISPMLAKAFPDIAEGDTPAERELHARYVQWTRVFKYCLYLLPDDKYAHAQFLNGYFDEMHNLVKGVLWAIETAEIEKTALAQKAEMESLKKAWPQGVPRDQADAVDNMVVHLTGLERAQVAREVFGYDVPGAVNEQDYLEGMSLYAYGDMLKEMEIIKAEKTTHYIDSKGVRQEYNPTVEYIMQWYGEQFVAPDQDVDEAGKPYGTRGGKRFGIKYPVVQIGKTFIIDKVSGSLTTGVDELYYDTKVRNKDGGKYLASEQEMRDRFFKYLYSPSPVSFELVKATATVDDVARAKKETGVAKAVITTKVLKVKQLSPAKIQRMAANEGVISKYSRCQMNAEFSIEEIESLKQDLVDEIMRNGFYTGQARKDGSVPIFFSIQKAFRKMKWIYAIQPKANTGSKKTKFIKTFDLLAMILMEGEVFDPQLYINDLQRMHRKDAKDIGVKPSDTNFVCDLGAFKIGIDGRMYDAATGKVMPPKMKTGRAAKEYWDMMRGRIEKWLWDLPASELTALYDLADNHEAADKEIMKAGKVYWLAHDHLMRRESEKLFIENLMEMDSINDEIAKHSELRSHLEGSPATENTAAMLDDVTRRIASLEHRLANPRERSLFLAGYGFTDPGLKNRAARQAWLTGDIANFATRCSRLKGAMDKAVEYKLRLAPFPTLRKSDISDEERRILVHIRDKTEVGKMLAKFKIGDRIDQSKWSQLIDTLMKLPPDRMWPVMAELFPAVEKKFKSHFAKPRQARTAAKADDVDDEPLEVSAAIYDELLQLRTEV